MSDQDTKKKIVEAGTYLFGVKGYDGTSTREIVQRAGVNLASLNYHFKSKQGLLKEVTAAIIEEFKYNINGIPIDGFQSTSDFAIVMYEMVSADSSKFLNHFKLFLDAEQSCCELEPQPLGYEQISKLLKKELNDSVPEDERLWAINIIISYIMHITLMCATEMGKKKIEQFMPNKKASVPEYIRKLVETLIRDLNHRY